MVHIINCFRKVTTQNIVFSLQNHWQSHQFSAFCPTNSSKTMFCLFKCCIPLAFFVQRGAAVVSITNLCDEVICRNSCETLHRGCWTPSNRHQTWHPEAWHLIRENLTLKSCVDEVILQQPISPVQCVCFKEFFNSDVSYVEKHTLSFSFLQFRWLSVTICWKMQLFKPQAVHITKRFCKIYHRNVGFSSRIGKQFPPCLRLRKRILREQCFWDARNLHCSGVFPQFMLIQNSTL